MKKAAFLLLVLLLFGCKKDPLIGLKSILEGRWKWHYSIEYKENLTTGIIYSTVMIEANNYADVHEIEFLSKGKVHFIVNNEIKEKYRLVFNHIAPTTCPLDDCFVAGIYLNNKKDDQFACYMNFDTLNPSKTTIPLYDRTEDNSHIYYDHYYLKVN